VTPRKIGFIDHFLDEWHANQYPVWIADPRHGGRYRVASAWAERDAASGLSTEAWCAKNGVERARSLEALIDGSDCLVVLSPDHPERHEELADLALRSGKPVYVDKTFALTRAAAERMFLLAERHGTPMYSSSALRFAGELQELQKNALGLAQGDVTFASAHGPGIFANYGIHQIEIIVATMGVGARRAMAHGTVAAPVVVFEYGDGRTSVVNHLPWGGFAIDAMGRDGKGASAAIAGDFWVGFIDGLLRFFDTGVSAVPKAETSEAMGMVEAGNRALETPGQWVDVPQPGTAAGDEVRPGTPHG
jgi:predicted dehydrogenase